MSREHLDKLKKLIKDLKESEGKNNVMKRAAMLAILLSFIRSTAGVASEADVGKLIKSISPDNDLTAEDRIWGNWPNWNNWKDWSNWNDWKNWNNWKDWKNWHDWRDWKNFHPGGHH